MSIYLSLINIEVFQHGTENKKAIFSGISNILPLEFKDNFIKNITSTSSIGYHKNEIIIHTYAVRKKDLDKIFIKIIQKILIHYPVYALFERVSEEGDLHIRLDKQIMISNGEFNLNPKTSEQGIYKINIKFGYHGKKSDKNNSINEFISSMKSRK